MFQEELYEDCDFSGTTIELNELINKKFIKCNFPQVDFTDLEIIYGCDFDNCNFSSASFNGVIVRNCSFLNCKFQFANFFATVIDNCKMVGSNFTNANCDLIEIHGGNWSYCILRDVDFRKKELSGINFFGADLSGSNFYKCKIRDCDIRESNVHNVSFKEADIRGSDISNIDILTIVLEKTKIDLQQSIIIAEAHGAIYKEE